MCRFMTRVYADRLTARELEIAALPALTNARIGASADLTQDGSMGSSREARVSTWASVHERAGEGLQMNQARAERAGHEPVLELGRQPLPAQGNPRAA